MTRAHLPRNKGRAEKKRSETVLGKEMGRNENAKSVKLLHFGTRGLKAEKTG